MVAAARHAETAFCCVRCAGRRLHMMLPRLAGHGATSTCAQASREASVSTAQQLCSLMLVIQAQHGATKRCNPPQYSSISRCNLSIWLLTLVKLLRVTLLRACRCGDWQHHQCGRGCFTNTGVLKDQLHYRCGSGAWLRRYAIKYASLSCCAPEVHCLGRHAAPADKFAQSVGTQQRKRRNWSSCAKVVRCCRLPEL
jgi:hypothetical protein